MPETAIIDAKSGAFEEAAKAKVDLLLAEQEGFSGRLQRSSHRHTPEIEQICSDLAGHDIKVQFTPHLIPMVRGILATVYATLRDPGLSAGRFNRDFHRFLPGNAPSGREVLYRLEFIRKQNGFVARLFTSVWKSISVLTG